MRSPHTDCQSRPFPACRPPQHLSRVRVLPPSTQALKKSIHPPPQALKIRFLPSLRLLSIGLAILDRRLLDLLPLVAPAVCRVAVQLAEELAAAVCSQVLLRRVQEVEADVERRVHRPGRAEARQLEEAEPAETAAEDHRVLLLRREVGDEGE